MIPGMQRLKHQKEVKVDEPSILPDICPKKHCLTATLVKLQQFLVTHADKYDWKLLNKYCYRQSNFFVSLIC